MFSLKIWPLVLATYSFIIDRDRVFLSATHIPNGFSRNLNLLAGGNVGCLSSDVCLPTESCQDDDLFGKCVEGNFDGSMYRLSYGEKSLLNNLKKDFFRVGLEFSNTYVQCVLRGLILKFRLQDKDMDIVKLCGEIPIEVVDNYKADGVTPAAERSNTFTGMESRTTKRFLPFLEFFDYEQNPRVNFYDKELGFQKDELGVIPERLMKSWTFEEDVASPFRYFDELTKEGADDETLLISQKKPPEGDKVAVKRFNRDKVVKCGTAEFDRRTKNTIWLRLSKPVNYIEADEILQELSENMNIRPPIAQFQLDKTGHVLLFFVPFETGLVANDVINMMRQNPQWMKENKVSQYGIGMPILTEPIAAPHMVGKIEHLSETSEYPMDETGKQQGRVGTGVGGQLSRVGFVVVTVVCSLAVLVALLLVAHTLVRRRDRLNDYLTSGVGKTSRKPSERPLVPPASPTASVASIAVGASPSDSGEKQHQESLSSCSTTSPPPYQETLEQDEKQGTFRRQIMSTGGSEASTESMAAVSNHRTSQLNSNSSWNDEPVPVTLDVTTGHLILSYMEEHLRNEDRLDADWEEINAYESEEAVPCESARRPENVHKNRDGCPIPYEQTRVMLSCRGNGYINASLMYDHDPRNPSYIAAATPLLGTVGDFWQMVWEQFAVVIVCLEPESALTQVIEDPFNITGQGEGDTISQARYWPPEGSIVFGKFEVRLVSEHKQCSDYITRSFYLKERDSGDTRTVTQFHFLTWLDDTPSCEVKTLLEFRRKVNKSFRAKNSPVVVHCSDGSSKTGTYLLLDLVLNRISKGVKELDVAASLEHLRDQRPGVIKTKSQFELVLAAIAEDVNMMLNPPASAKP